MLGKRNPAGEGGYDQDGDQLASDGHSLVGAQLPVLSQASLVVIRIYGSDVPSLRLGTGSGQESRGPRAAHSTPLLFWASAVGTQRENGAGRECPQPVSRPSIATESLYLGRVPTPMTPAQVVYGLICTPLRLSSCKAVGEKRLKEAEAWGM